MSKIIDFVKKKEENEQLKIEKDVCYLLSALSECHEEIEYLNDLVGLIIYEYYYMTKDLFESYPYNNGSYSNEFGLVSLEEFRREKLLQSVSQVFNMVETAIIESEKQIDYRESLIDSLEEKMITYLSKPYIRERTLYCRVDYGNYE